MATTEAFLRYGRLLDYLLWFREREGALSDDIEEMFAATLSECRAEMTPAEQEQIGQLIAERKSATNKPVIATVEIAARARAEALRDCAELLVGIAKRYWKAGGTIRESDAVTECVVEVRALSGYIDTSEDESKPIVMMTDEDNEIEAGGIIEEAATEMREGLAALAHDMWSGWMRYMFRKSYSSSSGPTAATIPGALVERWKRQMNTPYSELSEEEKESDRKEADRMIQIIGQFGRTMRMVQERAIE